MTASIVRSVYLRRADIKVVEIQAKVAIVKGQLKSSMAGEGVNDIDQRTKATQQAQCCMAAVEKKLDELRSADDDNWDKARQDFDNACEDVAQCIRNVMARYS